MDIKKCDSHDKHFNILSQVKYYLYRIKDINWYEILWHLPKRLILNQCRSKHENLIMKLIYIIVII